MAFKNIHLGDKAPESINVVIEIPRGTSNKYEYDEELDEILLDRVLHSPMFYPTEYGFVPGTRSEDGDHLDIMVLTTYPTFPGCVLKVRPVGVLDMEDEEGIDPKILAVAAKDPHFHEVAELDDVNVHLRKEIGHFFEAYKTLEDKWAKVAGWKGRDEAYRMIREAQERFAAEGHE
jgi:inorganic pyrophosphatase